ncbi:hypothetical protein F5141DRAFT_623095 [Pisolithus sp. B1]|nr:hypothetical protein F5141DRAFT_623095 [Pisolithus sp. B1]
MAGSGSKCRSPFEPIEAVQVHTRPVLLQGTDNPPRLLETSGITSTGRLYGQEPFLNVSTEGVEEQWERPQAAPLQGATATSTDGGAQDEQEEPQAVSSKEADKSTSKSEPEPDPTAASAGNDVDAAVEEFDGINPLSPIAKGAVDSMGSANAASTEVQALSDTYLEPLRVFNSVVSTLANVRVSFFHLYE